MKKLLIISEHFPANYSGLRRIYYNIKLFSKHFEVHFIRLNSTGAKQDQPPMAECAKCTEIICDKKRFDPIFLSYPIFIENVMKLASAAPQVQKYIKDEKIDCVMTHTVACTVAMHKLKAPFKIADMIDSVDLYYSRKFEHSKTIKNVLMLMVMRFCSIFRLISTSTSYNFSSYITSDDRKEDHMKPSLVSDEGRDPPLQDILIDYRDIDVLMLGLWKHPPNRDGLNEIRSKLGGIKGNITIIGAGLDKSSEFPMNVKVEGFVDSFSSYLSRAKVVLIPVYYGAGLQNKVFDALRNGCVVVTTEFTKKCFESSGYSSESIIAGNDIISAANGALDSHSLEKVSKAYSDYRKFYDISCQRQGKFADKILEMVSNLKRQNEGD